jgi:negative regulator of sigma E activity
MADQTQTIEATEPQVEKVSRWTSFTTNHPRATKVLGITAAAAAVTGVVVVVKNCRKDSDSTEAGTSTDQIESSPETTPVTEA